MIGLFFFKGSLEVLATTFNFVTAQILRFYKLCTGDCIERLDQLAEIIIKAMQRVNSNTGGDDFVFWLSSCRITIAIIFA